MQPGEVYHVLNKAVGDELLFRTNKDYTYFLKKLKRFILPVAKVYAYCLIPNHFHLMIRTKSFGPDINTEEQEEQEVIEINKAFSNFFNSYARSYNNTYKRKGKLFLLPFKRILVEDEDYFLILVNYIHRNPIHHGITNEYSSWSYSSYRDFLLDNNYLVDKNEVLSWFGGIADFIQFHKELRTIKGTKNYFLE